MLHGQESSEQYAPPEVTFSDGAAPYDEDKPLSYDSWSIGVIFLELILGTTDVFTVDQRTEAMIRRRMADKEESEIRKSLLLAGLADYCIYQPQPLVATENVPLFEEETNRNKKFSKRFYYSENKIPDASLKDDFTSTRVRAVKCSADQLSQAVHSRDPLGSGFHDRWGLDLLARLLQWYSSDRISMKEALEHAYFKGAHVSKVDNSEHATISDLQQHEKNLAIKALENDPHHLNSPKPYIARNAEFVSPNRNSKISADDGQVPTCSEDAPDSGGDSIVDDYIDELSQLKEFLWRLSEMPHDVRHSESEISSDALGMALINSGPNVVSIFEENDMKYSDLASEAPAPNEMDVLGDIITETSLDDIVFSCPKCGRKFRGDYLACINHAKSRRHGIRCLSEMADAMFPECISEHSMLPIDPTSGWCDLQGRRNTMEDTNAVAFTDNYNYFGVFDGHWGHKAATFAATHLHFIFEEALIRAVTSESEYSNLGKRELNEMTYSPNSALRSEPFSAWAKSYVVGDNLTESVITISVAPSDRARTRNSANASFNVSILDVFNALNEAFIETHANFAEHYKDKSGTTATVALLFPEYVVIANVGDSRAVICCGNDFSALAVTVDHSPDNDEEYVRLYVFPPFFVLRSLF